MTGFLTDNMKCLIGILFTIYVLGAAGMFAIHMQLPVTMGLAIVRALCWPVSVIARELVPRGTPQRMD